MWKSHSVKLCFYLDSVLYSNYTFIICVNCMQVFFPAAPEGHGHWPTPGCHRHRGNRWMKRSWPEKRGDIYISHFTWEKLINESAYLHNTFSRKRAKNSLQPVNTNSLSVDDNVFVIWSALLWWGEMVEITPQLVEKPVIPEPNREQEENKTLHTIPRYSSVSLLCTRSKNLGTYSGNDSSHLYLQFAPWGLHCSVNIIMVPISLSQPGINKTNRAVLCVDGFHFHGALCWSSN